MEYSHNPQNEKVRSGLQQATLSAGAVDDDSVARELVGAAAGVPHGASNVLVRAHNVRVDQGRHYFCPSTRYEALDLGATPRGDGTRIQERTRTEVRVPRIPRRDGSYDADIRVFNNNGSILATVENWRKGEEVIDDEQLVESTCS